MAKGIRMSIPSKTHGRAAKRLFHVFVDLGGKKHVASMGGNKYPMIMRDDFSSHAWMYFIYHKYDAASAFEKFLADLRAEGPPSEGKSSEFRVSEIDLHIELYMYCVQYRRSVHDAWLG